MLLQKLILVKIGWISYGVLPLVPNLLNEPDHHFYVTGLLSLI